jgi:hypothetical protein
MPLNDVNSKARKGDLNKNVCKVGAYCGVKRQIHWSSAKLE